MRLSGTARATHPRADGDGDSERDAVYMTARAACWMLHESYVPIECLKSSLAYDYVSRRLETTAESSDG